MRIDLPQEPDPRLRREPEIRSENGEKQSPSLPSSPLSGLLEDLERTPGKGVRRDVPRAKPGREPKRQDQAKRKREPEVRSRRTREGIADRVGEIKLRPEEKQMLRDAGRFRVLNVKDVAQTIYAGNERALRTDLEYLEARGLVTHHSLAPRNDGRWRVARKIEVIVLTRDGERVARALDPTSEQKLYHGLVKPREAEHDAQVYVATLKENERIEREGGRVERVALDFEIKSRMQKAIHQAQKANPERPIDEIKREVARELELPFFANKIEIPDARIYFDQGGRAAFSDVEVVTAAYRPGHLRNKVQAGFRLYAGSGDRDRLGKVEDEQHLLDWVMDL